MFWLWVLFFHFLLKMHLLSRNSWVIYLFLSEEFLDISSLKVFWLTGVHIVHIFSFYFFTVFSVSVVRHKTEFYADKLFQASNQSIINLNPKWYFLSKIVLTYCEKILFYWSRKSFKTFIAEGQQFANFWDDFNQWKVSTILNALLTCSWRFFRFDTLK